jgi:hypothetical protein
MENNGEECLLLQKTIYELVQAAARYNAKFCGVLISLGFKRCPSDPCLFLLIILSYVDDNLTIGKRSAIDAFLKEFKESKFTFTLEEGMSNYLSCNIQLDHATVTGWIGQLHMVKKIEKTFGEEVSKLQSYTTPGTPGFKLKKAVNNSE